MAAVPAPSRALAALGTRVEEAAARLSDAERYALELRENDGVRYAGIASAVDCAEDEVAPLLVAARLALYAGVRGAGAPEPAGDDCERARPLIAARQDGELADPVAGAWLTVHSRGCESCRATRLAMREATVAFHGAARAAGAGVTTARELGPNRRGSSPMDSAQVPVALPVAGSAAAVSERGATPWVAAPAKTAPARRAPRRLGAVLVAALAVIGTTSVVVSMAGGGDEPRRVTTPAPPAAAAPAATAAERSTVQAAAERRRRAAAERRRRAAAERRRLARSTPTPAATRAPAETAPSGTPDGESKSKAESESKAKSKARKPERRPSTPASGDAETETDTEGAGLGAPQSGATPGGVTDVCNEESPDCESG